MTLSSEKSSISQRKFAILPKRRSWVGSSPSSAMVNSLPSIATFFNLHGEHLVLEPLFQDPLPSLKTDLFLRILALDRNHQKLFHTTRNYKCRMSLSPSHRIPFQVPPRTSRCSKLWRYPAAVAALILKVKTLGRGRRKEETRSSPAPCKSHRTLSQTRSQHSYPCSKST